MEQEQHAIIIGSGPAGYTAAIYLGRAGYRPLVIAGALTPGGQLINTTEVENFPGFPDGVLGPDLMDAMKRQAERFGATFLQDDVATVQDYGSYKTITTNQGETFHAQAVIIATGSQYRKLGIPGEAEFSGRGVSYCATCDGFFFRGKPIVVVGGGDSAFAEAEFLSRFGSSVTLIHRRSAFRASKIMVDRARGNERITILTDSVVDAIHGDEQGVQSLSVQNVLSNEMHSLAANGVFVAIGHTPSTEFLGDVVARDASGYITVEGASTRTTVPGIFAAGDCVDSVYRQAISAAGMGCRAALDAQAYLAQIVG